MLKTAQCNEIVICQHREHGKRQMIWQFRSKAPKCVDNNIAFLTASQEFFVKVFLSAEVECCTMFTQISELDRSLKGT
jgi:hypothetical protein